MTAKSLFSVIKNIQKKMFQVCIKQKHLHHFCFTHKKSNSFKKHAEMRKCCFLPGKMSGRVSGNQCGEPPPARPSRVLAHGPPRQTPL